MSDKHEEDCLCIDCAEERGLREIDKNTSSLAPESGSEGKHPDSTYLKYDPFEGDRDTDVKMQTVRIVKVRNERECWMGLSPHSKPHKIKAGDRARYERALVDGAWCGYYVCLHCINSWLKSVGIEPQNDPVPFQSRPNCRVSAR